MLGGQFKLQAVTTRTMILMAGLGLAGCDENGEFEFPQFGEGAEASQGTAPLLAAPSDTMVEQDVESPDIFSVTDMGLWDGRPSLGGTWIAHPDVTDPERVIMRNISNGQSVIGALFRRERENPGPSFQVSSDAAEALGMLAGAPAEISVIALRREEVPVVTEVAEPVEAVLLDTPAEITETPLDDAPVTQAAVVAPLPAPTPPAPPVVPEPAVANVAAAADVAAAAMAAIAAAEPAPAAPAATPAVASDLDKPFIQIGTFSLEENADATAERLRSNGLSSRVLGQTEEGNAFWRVIVGPAPSVDDRDTVLAQVKSLGFPDAFSVTN